jgi:DNA-binding beta-propeller fold protein YncE
MRKIFFPWLLLLIITGCMKDKTPQPDQPDPNSGFPADVSVIINNKCSNTGCHTASSKLAAGGLSMETWDQLFQGGNGGAVAIAYRPDQSWVTYYTNTDTNKGVILSPTMPYLQPPLSSAEWQTLYDWLGSGAPNDQGVIPFSSDPNRKKFYVSNQGCDLVSVFDADTKLCMRAIDVGQNPGSIDVPHQIKISADGQFWYAVFVNGTVIQKYSTADDSYIGSIDIGTGYWNTLALSPDGKYAYAVDWSDQGKVAAADLITMQKITYYQGLSYPHGSWINSTGTTLYVTAQYGNFIYKFDVTNPLFASQEEIVIKPGQSPNSVEGTYDPHEIMLSPDESRYFVTCEASNEVRVMDAHTDTLLTVIPVGQFPQEMGISLAHNELFVTSFYTPSSEPKTEGSVDIIDLNTLQVVKQLQEGLFEPHGVGVMDDEGYVVISNRNLDIAGPAPHHVSNCGGRNGFIKLIDLNTLDFIPNYRIEVSVDPYSVAVRP